MAQSLGPMTAMLCMLRNTGKYRPKWEDAVKRAFGHIPFVDDIFETTRNMNKSGDVKNMISLLADIINRNNPPSSKNDDAIDHVPKSIRRTRHM